MNHIQEMSSLRLVALYSVLIVALFLICLPSLPQAFTVHELSSKTMAAKRILHRMSSSVDSDDGSNSVTIPNFNSVKVAKTGGVGMTTASQQAVAQDLSLGAPRARPKGGRFMTKGGIEIISNVKRLEYTKTGDELSLANSNSSEAVIESLVAQLDSHKGVLLTSSYEFPGRYARWTLGFVDPPLEISGRSDQCTIRALNDRGIVLLPAIERVMRDMKQQNVLSEVTIVEGRIDATVVPPPPVGTFSEEERSRQVNI